MIKFYSKDAMDLTFKELKRLNEAKGFLKKIKAKLLEKVSASDLGYISKLPFKAHSLQKVLIHRVADLTESAIDLFESQRLVPASLLTRGVFETTAVLYSLQMKIEQVIKEKQVKDLDDFLMRSLFGGRIKSSPMLSTNILNEIDRMSKKFEPWRTCYDDLSEYAHPNWSGLMGAYSYFNKNHRTLHLGKEFSKASIMVALPLLLISLAFFLHHYDQIEKQLPKCCQICEESLSSPKLERYRK